MMSFQSLSFSGNERRRKMMRKGLLISTMLVFVTGLGMSADVWAQCATTTCSSLGYTSSSNTGDCLKCPFGEAWSCPSITCPDSYRYSCSGTGYDGGSGDDCSGKYTKCTCASNYEWNNEECIALPWGRCSGLAKNCKIGDILFSDGTCASDVVSGKVPIAVVAYVSSEGCGQALALRNINLNSKYAFSESELSNLPFIKDENVAVQDFGSCQNSKILMETGDETEFPAVWAANAYSMTGTSSGNWCLPALGVLSSAFKNLDAVNTGLDRAGGIQLSSTYYIWSSTIYNSSAVYYLRINISDGTGVVSGNRSSTFYVRPVIEF